MDEKQKLLCEKEVLGFYLTSHPLAEHQATLNAYCTHTSTQCVGLKHRTEVLLGGMMAALKFSNTKNPKPGETNTRYVMFDLEDTDGIMRCILWPRDFAVHGHLAVADAIVAVRGSIDRREGSDEVNLIVNEIIPLDELAKRYTKGIRIRIDEQLHGEKGIDAVAEILRGYPGACDVEFSLWLQDGARVMLKSDTLRVGIDPNCGGVWRNTSAPATSACWPKNQNRPWPPTPATSGRTATATETASLRRTDARTRQKRLRLAPR